MDIQTVENSYARWAKFYDQTFGASTQKARARAVETICGFGGEVLEVGVGTGLALPFYDSRAQVTGIDFSSEMLAKARRKVEALGLEHVHALRRMDARELDFPDAAFDVVAAMHVLSVVPEPERVMAEIARVVKPGGHVVISNHFKHEGGLLGAIERLAEPLSGVLGWHSDFEITRILGEEVLRIEHREEMPPLGMMTLLVLRRAG